jgi:protein-S-isoprenylcysteine O-methyltransferase Ste14
MITIGNFFFKYRNVLFIFLYLAIFIPSKPIFEAETFGAKFYLLPILLGLIITISGELIRGLTIGLAYILRGGKNKKVYAEELVTSGIFSHCRNPLYVGNILMLLGVGILANSLLYVAFIMPLFLFIYQSIVLAEEHFLRSKFGEQFNAYCKRVNRWIPDFKGIHQTLNSMQFNSRRWLLKEYNTIFIWMLGIAWILLLKYPAISNYNENLQHILLVVFSIFFLIIYLYIRYLKKSGKLIE